MLNKHCTPNTFCTYTPYFTPTDYSKCQIISTKEGMNFSPPGLPEISRSSPEVFKMPALQRRIRLSVNVRHLTHCCHCLSHLPASIIPFSWIFQALWSHSVHRVYCESMSPYGSISLSVVNMLKPLLFLQGGGGGKGGKEFWHFCFF